MSNDLRTKITELPICEDKNLIESIIAIGTDGRTYRLPNEMLGNAMYELEWRFDREDDQEVRICIANTTDNNFYVKYHAGGILHITGYNWNDGIDIDITFVMHPDLNPINMTSGAEACNLEKLYPIYSYNGGLRYINAEILLNNLQYEEGDIMTINIRMYDSSVSINPGGLSNFEITGVFFEAVPVVKADKVHGDGQDE